MKLRFKFFKYYGLPLLYCGATIGGLGAALQEGIPSFTADGYDYSSNLVGHIRIQGVCTTDLKEFSCWNPDGTQNLQLARQAENYFQKSNSGTIDLVFRQKPLLLVTAQTGGSLSNGMVGYWSAEKGQGFKEAVVNQNWDTSGEPGTHYYWMFPDSPQKVDDLSESVYATLAFPPITKPAVGSNTSINGQSVTITGIVEHDVSVFGTGSSTGQGPAEKQWQVNYKRTDFPDIRNGQMVSREIGAEPVSNFFTISKGKLEPLRPNKPFLFINSSPPFESYDDASSKTGHFTINVDPKRIEYIKIAYVKLVRVKFHNIALQPKP